MTPLSAKNLAMPLVDPAAIHLKVRPLTTLPLEIIGGIKEDQLLVNLQRTLARQFGPFVGKADDGLA